MALNFQDISIPLTEGQSAGRDASLIQPPEFLKVTNGEFGDRSNIRVVDGLTNLPITLMAGEVAPDDTNPTLRRLLKHKDEILLETYKGIFRQQVGGSFALAAGLNNRKRDRLRCMRAGVSSIVDAANTKSQDWSGSTQPFVGTLGFDAAQTGDYTCTVWCEQVGAGGAARGQIGWQVRHATSDALVGAGAFGAVGSTAFHPRVVTFGGLFYVFALVDGDIGRVIITPTSTQNVASTMTKITAVGTYNQMDVALSPTHYCISVSSTAPAIQQFIFTQAAPTVAVGLPFAAVPGVVTHLGNTYIDTGGAGINQGFVVFYVCTGTLNSLRWYVTSPAAVASGPAVQAGFTDQIRRVFPVKECTGSASLWPVIADMQTGASTVDGNKIAGLSYDATAASPGGMATGPTATTIVEDHFVMGQPISVSGSAYAGESQTQGLWLPVHFSSVRQNTFQVLDIARALGASLRGGSAIASFSVLRVFDAGAVTTNILNSQISRVGQPVLVPSSGGLAAHVWCPKFTPNITNVTDLGQNPTHIQRNTLNYAEPLGDIEFADLTYMAGGTPLVYDGQDVFEEGFTYAPEIVSITVGAGVTPLSVGVYAIVFVYEWYDGQGNRWQSAPSKPTVFTTTVGNQTFTAVVRSLTASLKSGVQAIPYRTQADGTIFYRDSPLGEVAQTDADIANCELLYTGGVLTFVGTQSNNGLPGVKQFTVHQNRLVAVGGEYGRGFFYSKERDDDFPAEFNRASGFGLVPEVTGRVATASSIDDKLALFAENGVAVVFGQGPNRAWTQNGYTAPVRIQAAEGVRFDTPFIAEVDDGVWYVTNAGPRLLSRGLATAKGSNGLPLGDELRTTTQQVIGACEVVFVHPSKAQVLFSSIADGLTYIYDYQRNKWTQRDDDEFSISQTSARGVRYTLSAGVISDAETLRYEDPAQVINNNLVLETGWISLSGVQRFQRLTHLSVCGTWLYKGVYGELVVGLQVYGMEAPTTVLQNSTVTLPVATTVNEPWRCDFQMVKQTDTAYKLRLTLIPESGVGGNFSITSLLARVGSKRGGAKLPNAQRG
jgi:hypothetical protein